jgi:hypothetical protein
MRDLRGSFTLCLLASAFVFGSVSYADPVSYTPPTAETKGIGNLVTQLPVSRIGSLALPRGLAVLSGHSIEIQAVPEWLFDRDTVLSGAVINPTMTVQGGNSVVRGLAFFNGGSWLRSLAAPTARDTIRTASGESIPGNIQAVLPDGLEILQLTGGRRKIAYAEIANLESPRAYTFVIDAASIKIDPTAVGMQGDAGQIVFTPAGLRGRVAMHKAVVPPNRLPGTEGGVPNSVIASEVLIDVAMNVVAPAVTIPSVLLINHNQNIRANLRTIQAQQGTNGIVIP